MWEKVFLGGREVDENRRPWRRFGEMEERSLVRRGRRRGVNAIDVQKPLKSSSF